MSRGIVTGYDDVMARLRVKHAATLAEATEPHVRVKGTRYPTIPAADLQPGYRVISPEGLAYDVEQYIEGLLVVRGPNGAQYRWRRKPHTMVPVTRETRRSHRAV